MLRPHQAAANVSRQPTTLNFKKQQQQRKEGKAGSYIKVDSFIYSFY